MRLKSNVMDEAQVRRTLIRMSHEIIENNRGVTNIVLAGLLKRGIHIAKEIASIIQTVEGREIPVIELDITQLSGNPKSKEETLQLLRDIPFALSEMNIIIVDDVLFTGRTVRSAVDILNSAGELKKIQLAVLIDRGNREMPISADFIGKLIPSLHNEFISVNVTAVDGACGIDIYELN